MSYEEGLRMKTKTRDILMEKPFLSPHEVAKRWKIKKATLDQWRWFGHGPHFFTLGTRIRYRLEDIERFENLRFQQTITSERDPLFSRITLPTMV